MYEGFEVS